MRPTLAHHSEMPGPKVYNLWWGDAGNIKQKGIVEYTLSPFQQRPSKDMFKGYLFNGVRRLGSQAPYWAVPFVVGYSIYAWAKSYDRWQNSKEGHLAGAGGH